MKTNENKNEIVWTSRKEWGYDGRTHQAEGGGWRFHAGRVGKEWVLRGWGPDQAFIYRPARTLARAKELAALFVAATVAKEEA